MKKNLQVHLIQRTPEAERLLALAKNTRLLGGEDPYAVYNRPMEEVMQDVQYSMDTIRGPLEFVHYVFLIQNASRAMTHQLVRHRVVSFAQQSLRISESLDYYIPPGIEFSEVNNRIFEDYMETTHKVYKRLMEVGADRQDARGVLPIATTSAILMKANLRAMLELFEVRLCLRVQGEFQDAALQMRDLLVSVHPWTARYAGVHCLVKGTCLFPRFDCPVSNAVPELKGLPPERRDIVNNVWSHLSGKGFQPK